MVVELAPELLEILACPNCHGALAVDHDRDELVCLAADCGLAYPVRQGIPVLLIDEARRPGGSAEPDPPTESQPPERFRRPALRSRATRGRPGPGLAGPASSSIRARG